MVKETTEISGLLLTKMNVLNLTQEYAVPVLEFLWCIADSSPAGCSHLRGRWSCRDGQRTRQRV